MLQRREALHSKKIKFLCINVVVYFKVIFTRENIIMINNCKATLILITLLFGLFYSNSSEAIPAFARKYNLTCTVCHTKPPRLNPFGEAFHMAGFQIPMTEGGEIIKKKKIGRVNLETDFLNIFALRTYGNLVESYQSSADQSEFKLTLPQAVELYFAGTITQDISFFFEMENELYEIEGVGNSYEMSSKFGLGKEFFLMFNLNSYRKKVFDKKGNNHDMMHGSEGMMSHGPMIMIGKIDPSTNFSYSTNRQFFLTIPGEVQSGMIKRFSLTPYAFASKFYGMKNGEGDLIEVTKPVLYNTAGDLGVDVHGMMGPFLYQIGAMQGAKSGMSDVNENKDIYFAGRYNFGDEGFFSGSLSSLLYWGNDSASVSTTSGSSNRNLIDWFRYGFAGNIKYKLLDLYGALMWDKINNLPQTTLSIFDDKAFGLTIELDYLASDHLLLSARYDQLNAGGFVTEKENGKVMSLQAKYYTRDNFSLFLRDSWNIEGKSNNPLNSYRNLITLGVDLDF